MTHYEVNYVPPPLLICGLWERPCALQWTWTLHISLPYVVNSPVTELMICPNAALSFHTCPPHSPDNRAWWEADLQRWQRVQWQVLCGSTHGRDLQVLLQQQDVNHDTQDCHVHHWYRRGTERPGHGDRRYVEDLRGHHWICLCWRACVPQPFTRWLQQKMFLCVLLVFILFNNIFPTLWLCFGHLVPHFIGGDSWDGRAQGRLWLLSLRCTAEFSLTSVVSVA